MRVETDRLLLRSFEESDLDGLHELLTSDMYYVDDVAPSTKADTQDILKVLMQNSKEARSFAIVDRVSGDFIGRIGYKNAMMGFMFLQRHNGKGYAGESGKAVIDYAFGEDGLGSISAGCYADNVPMQKLLEKLGFPKESIKVEKKEHDGVVKDKFVYTLMA